MKQFFTTKTTVPEQKFKGIKEDEFLLLKQILRKKGELEIVISGTSMLPLIKNANMIKVAQILNLESLKRFDILVYWNDEKLICHYFWHKNIFFTNKEQDTVIQTRPLNPINRFDGPIEYSKVLGIVTNFKITSFQKFKIISLYIFAKYFPKAI